MRIFFILLFLCTIIKSYSQEYYFFKHGSYWLTKIATKPKMETQKVLVLMDTVNFIANNNRNKQIAIKLVEALKYKNIVSSYVFIGNKIDTSDALIVRFKSIKPGGVKLTIFADGIPLCRRFEIRLSNAIIENENFYCPPILSINLEKEDEGIDKSSKRMAQLIQRILK